MSNLIREPRTDKRGVVVNRWIRESADSPSPALVTAPPTITATDSQAASMGAEILSEYDWIKVSDGVELRSLSEFSDPDIASGSCWRVTSELIETVDFGEHGFDCTPTFANALGSATQDGINVEHYAVFLDSDNTVMDFTIRQFDQNLDFPLITSFDDWSRLMKQHLGPNVGLSVGEIEYDDEDDDDDDEYGEY